jgi:hypothetical protein
MAKDNLVLGPGGDYTPLNQEALLEKHYLCIVLHAPMVDRKQN